MAMGRKRAKGRRAPVGQASAAPAAREGKRGADAIAAAALIAAPLVFFWRAALLRGILIQSDICAFFEPAKVFMHEALRAGRLPLWSPYIFCGYPMAAEGQIAAFYPPALLISWLLPSSGAVNWLIILHVMLAGVGMYLLARALGVSRFGAWLSAFIFSFSGYLFAHLHHVSLVCAAAWLPFVLLFIERAWRGSFLPNAVLAAAAWAGSALCGHPQTTFHTSLAAIFWIGWGSAQSLRACERKVLLRAARLAAFVFALGLGLAAVQLLLTADLSATAPHGDRGSLAYVTSFSLLPKHLLGLLAPNWQGTIAFDTYRGERYYWEYVLYLGIVPLLLALVGATARRGWVWAGVALAALALALGEGNPIYEILRFVPGFRDFRVPARYIFLFTFATAILAAIGWDVLASWRRLARGRLLLAAAAIIATATVADLGRFDRTLAPLADPEVVEATPRVVQLLHSDPAWGRSLIVPPISIYADWTPPGGWAGNPNGWVEARAYLPASVPQSFGLRTIGGYAGFVDQRQALFFQAATVQALQQGRYDLYSLVGTRYFVVAPDMKLPGLPAADVPPFRVYRNERAFPRAFVIGEVVSSSDDAEAHRLTVELANTERLGTTAAVREPVPTLSAEARASVVAVEEPRPERVTIRARADGEVLIVLNERWDRGWRARVDGRPAPLLEVDTVLMGTRMPAGEHTIEFLYCPRGLVIGRVVSAAALAACLALFAASFRRARPG